MAPITIVGYTGSLQVIIGCVVPFLAVLSFIPLVVYRRYLATRSVVSEHETRSRAFVGPTPRVTATPRLPLTSVYVARVDYYLPAIDTGTCTMASFSVAESDVNHSAVSLPSMPSLPSLPVRTPERQKSTLRTPEVSFNNALSTLPSLPSIFNEFSAYADAIEPKVLTEARRSSTCLLDSAFSSMGNQAQPCSSLSDSVIQAQASTSICNLAVSTPPERCFSRLEIRDYTRELESEINRESFETISSSHKFDAQSSVATIPTFSYQSKESPKASMDHPNVERDPFLGMDIESLCMKEMSIKEEKNNHKRESIVSVPTLPHLVPSAASKLSLIVDSCSTIGSVLAVRLSDFPPVPVLPTLPSKNLSQGQNLVLVTRQSISSINSTVSRSLSAPASLNILEIRVEDFFRTLYPYDRPARNRLIDCRSLVEPGELWDDEDDKLFAVESPSSDLSNKPCNLSRHTWTAGVAYGRQDQGDLWDDEDEKRFSAVVPFKFKGLGLFAFEVESGTCDVLGNSFGSMNGVLPSLSLDSDTTLETQGRPLEAEKMASVVNEQQKKIHDVGLAVNWPDGERIRGLELAENVGVSSIEIKGPEDCETHLALYYNESKLEFWDSSPAQSQQLSLASGEFGGGKGLDVNLFYTTPKQQDGVESVQSSRMSFASVLDTDACIRYVKPRENDNREEDLGNESPGMKFFGSFEMSPSSFCEAIDSEKAFEFLPSHIVDKHILALETYVF